VASDSKSNTNRPFDTQMVEFLVKLMADKDLSEIDLHEGEHRIRLRRGARVVTTAPVVAAAPVMAAAPASEAAKPAVAAAAPSRKYHEIKSPMVGTFYSKPKPDADDYVKVGSKVKLDTIVCKLEAMKIFNDMPAECNGTVVEVCVQSGSSVEFGTVLFRIDLG
jgi:acetyl-CoA carboxylase biotin carboxyl carrier protein